MLYLLKFRPLLYHEEARSWPAVSPDGHFFVRLLRQQKEQRQRQRPGRQQQTVSAKDPWRRGRMATSGSF
jgi:hypothetical protein